MSSGHSSRKSSPSAWKILASHQQSLPATGHPDRYKIKLRSIGYRLVYEVRDSRLIVVVVAVGKREGGDVYKVAANR
ncbi:MAG: type II toxin-antitoxin system RelE/ParE family toxin [Rhodocyclaceae bacterium]|nr:type II toxin-antitoxin system RelE/ParE family toxin [Rhodocyclaceae bacterium]MDZ4215261.1 type II toxin-antitoxin system RelE/ParE family toxin [Rhodocyclaceae bacterium]